MNIRPASLDDLPSLLRMEQQAAGASHWSEARYRAIFDPAAPRRAALVIETDVIVGFIVASVVDSEWEIENIVIDENSRRHGLGRALILELLDRARAENASSVFLEVRTSNLAARGLYESLGFAQIAARSAYYLQPPEDAIVYRFEIR